MLDQNAPPRARTLMWHIQKPIFYTQHFFRNSEFRIRNSEFRIRNSEFRIRISELRSFMNHKILVTKPVEYTLQ